MKYNKHYLFYTERNAEDTGALNYKSFDTFYLNAQTGRPDSALYCL